MVEELWEKCLARLGDEISEDHFDTYIRPLQSKLVGDTLTLLAPNIYVEEQIKLSYLGD